MKISHPQNDENKELTPEELQELEKLKRLINYACADGKITQEEMDTIKVAMRADNKVTFEELQLLRTMISDKMAQGQIEWDWEPN